MAQTDLVPGPIGFDPPAPGALFLLSGFAAGRRTDVPQRSRFVSTVFLVGDRDLSGLDGCLGSAASAASTTFGVVAACEPGKTPIITLFRAARAFLERNIPGWRQPSLTEASGGYTPAGAVCAMTTRRSRPMNLASDARGALRRDVVDGCAAARLQLTGGDIIRAINRHPVHSAADARRRLRSIEAGRPIFLLVWRSGVEMFLRMRHQ